MGKRCDERGQLGMCDKFSLDFALALYPIIMPRVGRYRQKLLISEISSGEAQDRHDHRHAPSWQHARS